MEFGPFRLDPAQRLLVRPGATIALRPKTLEVLLLLLGRNGDVVSKEEILASVWEGTAVSEYVLTTCISELRAALGDRTKDPLYVRTVHRTGYRLTIDRDATPTDDGDQAASAMVGRERELAQLQTAWGRCRAGGRQIVFITGEMGIGKTTLADRFVTGLTNPTLSIEPPKSSQSASPNSVLVARGQCVEQFGAGEPYMPVLEAIGRLGRGPNGPSVVDVLRRHAPAWLALIPGLLPPEQRAELRRESPAQTQEYMLRQIADGIEALSEYRSLVLFLEDLHLSDHATLELIAALSLRHGRAQLLIVGTFRDAEVFPSSSPFQRLKQQLLLHRQCEEIALAPLGVDAIAHYLAKRFPDLSLPPGLAKTIHERTEGNPLFIARLIDHFVEEGTVTMDSSASLLRVADGDISRRVPRNLRAMIEQRTESLSDEERDVLETASVAGIQFWSASIAAALGRELEDVEILCAQLSRHRGFLKFDPSTDVTPPDLGSRYGFRHALYQQVLYERIETTRRRRLHAAVAVALRDEWGERAGEAAAELASHFERGGDSPSAVVYFDKAAAAASNQGANREALGYLDRALALLEHVRDESTRREQQLDLRMKRGPSVLAVSGYGSKDVLDNYERALELARQVSNPMAQMTSLVALSTSQQTRGNLNAGEELAVELVRVGEQIGLPAPLLSQLKNPLSQVRMYKGAVEESLALADAAVAAMQIFPMPLTPPGTRPALWTEPSVMLHCQHGSVSFAAGRFAQTAAAVAEALRIAGELQHPFNLASACTFAALYEDSVGQWQRAITVAQQAIDTSRAYDFPFWQGIAQIFCGHAMARSGNVEDGLKILREGVDIWRSTGARLANSNHLNLLADACLVADDVASAQSALTESATHAEQSEERVFLAETYRLQAECLRRTGSSPKTIEALLQKAIDTARGQGTKVWELRSSLALHRLRATAKTRRQLATICSAFAQEPAMHDVTEARLALGE